MSKNFNLHEFSSPSVVNGKANYRKRIQVPAKLRGNVATLCKQLEVVRAALGSVPMNIASGWRDLEFNGLNPGRAKASLHLQGKAADITVKGVSPARVYWVISDLIKAGAILPGGLAKYPGFVHYDCRGRYANGRMARWRKAPKRPTRGLGSLNG